MCSIHNTWLLHTNKTAISNTPIIQDSILGLGGQEESWWGFSGPIYFKLSGCIPYIILDCYTPIKQPTGTLLSSKTPSWDLEDRSSLDGVLVVRFTSIKQPSGEDRELDTLHYMQRDIVVCALNFFGRWKGESAFCLLYTSDAADE